MTNNLNAIPFKDAGYKRPRKNVLAISCIDLRLTDNLVKFLHAENLDNRYDHVALAGASLCCGDGQKPYSFTDDFKKMAVKWKDVLLEHLTIAVQLHQIEDVYIIEHEDCGAYKNFLVKGGNTGEEGEWDCHLSFAQNLSEIIRNFDFHFVSYEHILHQPDSVKPADEKPKSPYPVKFKNKKLNVHAFMMDVSGNVYFLFSSGISTKA